jgi:saccharopine dehydrogenase-like NADP-dependent oxidoreductase
MPASILIVGGAGHMGSRAARALLEDAHKVTIGDRRRSAVEGAGFVEVDATDSASVEAAARDADLVMNFAGPYYAIGDAVARAAVRLGKPYVDICDDAAATEDLLALDGAAGATGATVVIGAGSSPGLLNAFALRCAEGFDELDELVLAWVVGEKSESGPAPLRHFFYGISREIPIWQDGQRAMVQAFGEDSAEEFPFQAPLGRIVVRDVGHPETVTLPRVVGAKSVRNKGALLPRQSTEIYALLNRLGLTGDRATQVDGRAVVAGEFLAAFLTDRHNERAGDASQDLMGLGVRAVGSIGGRSVQRCLSSAGHMSMADSTALPAAATVALVLGGDLPAGAHGPEVFDPAAWFGELGRIAPHVYTDIEVWEGDGARVATSLDELARVSGIADLLGAAA